MLYGPLESLTYTAWALEGAAAGAQRCFEVLDREDEVKDLPNARTLATTKGAIAFDQISFGYDPNRLILKDVNAQVDPARPSRLSAAPVREKARS